MKIFERIDRAIYSVAPVWGARRIATRRRLASAQRMADRLQEVEEIKHRRHVENLHDGDRNRLRDERWLTSRLSPNSELEDQLEKKRERSNELYKRDDVAHGIIESLVNGVFGTSCRIKARTPQYDGVSKALADRVNKQLEWVFTRWAPYAGIDGSTFLQQLRLAERCLERDGDVLIKLSDRSRPGKVIPLAVEVIEASRIETPPDRITDPNVRLGVETDSKTGEPIAYWVRTAPPGDTVDTRLSYTRVACYDAAGRKRACLVMEKLWPGQLRGLPRLFAALNQLKDRSDLREILVINQQIACCFNVFIKTVGDPEAEAEGAATDTIGGRRYEDLEPGMIHRLARDEEIETAAPNATGLEMVGLLDQDLHGIAAAAQLPYAVVARNWSRFTYSGGRLERIDERNSYKIRQQLWRETALYAIGCLILFEGVAVEEIEISPLIFAKYEWLFALSISWLISLGDWMDPKVDVQAAGLEIESNLSTLSEKLAERGKDLDEVLDERADEIKKLTERGLPTVMPMMQRDQTDPNQQDAQDQQEAALAGSK